MVQLSHPYMTTGKSIALTTRTFVGKVTSLLFNTLSRLVITFLPRSKRLLISWLQSPSAVILEPKKRKSVTVFIVSPSICHEVIGPDAMILVFSMLSFKSDQATNLGVHLGYPLPHILLYSISNPSENAVHSSLIDSFLPPFLSFFFHSRIWQLFITSIAIILVQATIIFYLYYCIQFLTFLPSSALPQQSIFWAVALVVHSFTQNCNGPTWTGPLLPLLIHHWLFFPSIIPCQPL